MESPLWAPWRMEFILGEKPKGCIFCLFPAEDRDRENLIVARTAHSVVMLNKYPYNNGHLLVIPRRHTSDPTQLPKDEYEDWNELLRRALAVLGREYKPQGYNVGLNLGAVAGAGIAEHLHWHIVPRWAGDNNFMPVIGETRVMAEHLSRTWDRLEAAFAAA